MSARILIRVLIVLVMLFIAAGGGCLAVKKVEENDESNASTTSVQSDPGSKRPQTALPFMGFPGMVPNGPGPAVTQASEPVYSDAVYLVDPVPAQQGEHMPRENPCNVSRIPMTHYPPGAGVLVNETTIFAGTYVLNHSAVGLKVNADAAPFFISFSVTPRYPDSVARSSLTVTVRDADTLELVVDDGYNGLYSSDTEKTILLYRPGAYIVTLDGRYVSVAVGMGTKIATSG